MLCLSDKHFSLVNEEAHCERAVIAHLQFSQYDNRDPSVSRSSDFFTRSQKNIIFLC